MDATVSAVFSGGNALGAFHAGAWQAVREAGLSPTWLAGASIGAITACIIAGNAPADGQAALDRFWERAAAFSWPETLVPPLARKPLR